MSCLLRCFQDGLEGLPCQCYTEVHTRFIQLCTILTFLLQLASVTLETITHVNNSIVCEVYIRVGDVQVVHLYQELRKLMGDNFMVKELNSQDPAAIMLRGRRPFQALTAADEQARQRSLADDPAALQVRDLVNNNSCFLQCVLFQHGIMTCLLMVCCLAEIGDVYRSLWHL